LPPPSVCPKEWLPRPRRHWALVGFLLDTITPQECRNLVTATGHEPDCGECSEMPGGFGLRRAIPTALLFHAF
jgi:hypothetical protein